MSRFVALFGSGERPADAALLRRLLHYAGNACGATGLDTRVDGAVALGQASWPHSPPASDGVARSGELLLVGDVRLDARDDLLAALRDTGHTVAADASDSALLLEAYAAWGEQCVERLLGDFSFVLWDGARRRLFAARDHIGVRPFYYAFVDGCLVAANSQDAVRLHPGVSERLNDQAIADYLLFDFNLEVATTSFADVFRLPAAHLMTCVPGGRPRLRRYWSVPVEEPMRFRHPAEAVEQFAAAFDVAVRDRLPRGDVVVALSGGMDSTSVAAVAAGLAPSAGARVQALNAFDDRHGPDPEGRLSAEAAAFVGIPLRQVPSAHYRPFEGLLEPRLRAPEPFAMGAFWANNHDFYAGLARSAPVAMTGHGVEPILAPDPAHIYVLIGAGRWGTAAGQLLRHVRMQRRLPRLALRSVIRGVLRPRPLPPFPAGLEPGLVARLGLEERWRARQAYIALPARGVHLAAHPWRPAAYESLTAPVWPTFLEGLDAGSTRLPLQVRYPAFDLRVARMAMRLTSFPWCYDKWVLREAMRGRLPEAVRARPKTPLRRDRSIGGIAPVHGLDYEKRLADARLWEYIDRTYLQFPTQMDTAAPDFGRRSSALCLHCWLLNGATLPAAPQPAYSEGIHVAAR